MCLLDCDSGICNECYSNCLLFHRAKNDDSPDASSFFKIMFGKTFSKVLVTPPKFSRTNTALAGKITYLEDYTGQKWEVNLSVVNGIIAIQKGWPEFCLDHNIEMGDLLVFRYVAESHFVVLIWGRSGCPKTFRAVKSDQNKRPKTTVNSFTRRSSDGFHEEREPASENGCFNPHDDSRLDTKILPRKGDLNHVNMSPRVTKDSQNKEYNDENPQVFPDVYKEPNFLSDREPSGAKEDDREHRLNLYSLEQPELKSSIAKEGDKVKESDMSTSKKINKNLVAREDTREIPTHNLTNVGSSSAKRSNGNHLPDVSMVTEKKVETNHIGQLQKNVCFQVPDTLKKAQSGDDLKSTKGQLTQGQRNTAVASNKNGAKLSRPESSPPPIWSPSLGGCLKPDVPLKSMSNSQTVEPPAAFAYCQLPGETNRIVKQEPGEFEEDLGDTFLSANFAFDEKAMNKYGDSVNLNPMEVDVKITNIVKSEPVDFCETAPAPFIRVTCVVPPDDDGFLELPEPLPVSGRKGRLQKLIFLRDQDGKDWPVIYHYKSRFKVLTSGWDAFRKCNSICPGDECGFVVENIENNIFRVYILNP